MYFKSDINNNALCSVFKNIQKRNNVQGATK